MRRRHRPAPGQLTFTLLVLVDDDPAGPGGGAAEDLVVAGDVAVPTSRTARE